MGSTVFGNQPEYRKFWKALQSAWLQNNHLMCSGSVTVPIYAISQPCEEVEEGQPHNPYSEILVLQHHSDIVRLLLQIDEKRFASAGDDNKIVIWEVQHGSRISTMVGHTHPITCMVLLPTADGNSDPLIVSGSSDKQLRIWNCETGECLNEMTAHGTSVRFLLVLTDGLFCGGGEFISLWNYSGQFLHSIKNCSVEDIHLMIRANNSQIIAAANKELVIYKWTHCGGVGYEIVKVRHLQSHREAIQSLVKLSQLIFASGSVDGMIVIWQISTMQPMKKLNVIAEYEGRNREFPYSIQDMFSVQERYLVAATGCGFSVYDLLSEKDELIVRKKSAHHSKITAIGFSCENDFLITCSEDSCLRLWGRKLCGDHNTQHNVESMTAMERFTGIQDKILSQMSSPYDPFLLGECCAHSGTVQCFLDFSNEGIVSCGADSLVIIWKNVEMQKVKRNQAVQQLLFHRDGIV